MKRMPGRPGRVSGNGSSSDSGRSRGTPWCLRAALFSLTVLAAGCQQMPVTHAEAAPPRALAQVFGWPFLPAGQLNWRGGTTTGGDVTLATAPDPRWLALQADGIDAFERDRRAILAMAGDFRVGFQFVETMGFSAPYTPAAPYFSWATERVDVLEDRGDFISLQHTMVMYFKQPDGSVGEPMVMKHWRQDWTYQDTDLHVFEGGDTWQRRTLDPQAAKGTWSQAVFHVDDSPRYEAVGRWQHGRDYAAWYSDTGLRPLPRREHSVRSDYDVLEGDHRLTITPQGWVHEQSNRKVKQAPAGAARYVAAETGLNRYERISAPSLADADDYWRATGAYWQAVRQIWREVYGSQARFHVKSEYDGKPLFAYHFQYADDIRQQGRYDAEQGRAHAEATVRHFVEPAER